MAVNPPCCLLVAAYGLGGHQAGLWHRHIKPANILIRDDDKLTLLSDMDLPGYTPTFLAAVDKTLAIRAKDGALSVDEWLALFEAPDGAIADALDSGGDTTVLCAFGPVADQIGKETREPASALLS